MFPLNQSNHIMEKRSREKFKDVRCNTERFRKSALPYMRKILNKDYSEKKKILGNLINCILLLPMNFTHSIIAVRKYNL